MLSDTVDDLSADDLSVDVLSEDDLSIYPKGESLKHKLPPFLTPKNAAIRQARFLTLS